MRKFVIYGVGNYLEECLTDFEGFLDNVLMIADGSSDKVGKKVYGFEIKPRDELKNISDEIIVAIASKKFYESIKNDIKDINPKLKCIPLYEALLSLYPVIGYCNLCHSPVAVWRKIGEDNNSKYSIISNGVRRGGCPVCKSYDRHRWQYYVINNFTSLPNKESVVLHFAPEYKLLSKFKDKISTHYYTADIQEGRADYVVDITDISFEDKTFDYIIANHVLEHIPDEKKAITELIRCLKDDGTIILSFPYCLDIDTLEDANIQSEEDRKKYYGQNDHVRLYGRDYKERLERYGLKVKTFRPIDLLDKQAIIENGFIEKDMILFCKKN